jgi:hypothetical protein
MDFAESEDRKERYIHEVSRANSEATKAFLFLEFIRGIFREVQTDQPHKLQQAIDRFQ